MNIVVAGGTGFIGSRLCWSLRDRGHRVTILTRRGAPVERLCGATMQAIEWDAVSSGRWEEALVDAHAVVNLAGAPIADARWTPHASCCLLTAGCSRPVSSLTQCRDERRTR